MTARNYLNGAPLLTISAGVNTTDVTLTVSSTTGYPTVPFLIVLERATANEEVVLCTAKSGTTFTVTRGYDGTTGKNHSLGAAIEHATAAIDYNEANFHINDVAHDHHTQYARKAQWTAKGVILSATAAATMTAVAVGTNDQVLVADSAQASGLKWATLASASIVDGSVTFAKLAAAVQKTTIQSVAAYGAVASPVLGQEVYDSTIDRYANFVSGGWQLRPYGVGKIWSSTSAPSGGSDGDLWLRYT